MTERVPLTSGRYVSVDDPLTTDLILAAVLLEVGTVTITEETRELILDPHVEREVRIDHERVGPTGLSRWAVSLVESNTETVDRLAEALVAEGVNVGEATASDLARRILRRVAP